MKSFKPETKIWALDTEDNSQGKLFMINIFDGETHYTFRKPRDFFEFCALLDGWNEFWACNMAYDINNLIYNAPDYLTLNYVESRFISAESQDLQIIFKDTLNHWKMSVAEMGKRIGLPKLDAEGNFNNLEYCRRDTEIVWRFVNDMKARYELMGAKLKSTIGATALDHFKNFTGFNPRVDRLKQNEVDFLSQSVYGGRVEIFHTKKVKGPIWWHDFNSLYPAVMASGQYPRLDDNKRRFTKKPNFELEGVAHVRIECRNNLDIPFLHTRHDGSLIFPSGEFDGFYTYPEIRKAIQLGYRIKKVYRALEFYGGTANPFKKWIFFLYESRLKAQKISDELMSLSFKLLMNNLFGKFGQGNEKTVLCSREKVKTNIYTILANGWALEKQKGFYPPHTNFIWSAYTTAYGRIKLFDAMIFAKSRGAKVLYCDTDSIFYQHSECLFENSDKIGELKLETKLPLASAEFKNPKQYCLEFQDGKRKYKVKGVPSRSAEEFFITAHIRYKKPNKLRETLRRNVAKSKKRDLIPNYWESIQKYNRKTYSKRKVLPDGTTKPIIVQ